MRFSGNNKYKKWLTLRRLAQYLALAGFVTLTVAARTNQWDAALFNLFMRIDPLAMVMSAVAARAVIRGSLIAATVILLALLFGRAWCGWLCPLGTALDIFRFKRPGNKLDGRPDNKRRIKYGLLIVIFVAALFGNLTFMVLDPITISLRTLSLSIWPALDTAVTAAERTLYRVPFLSTAIGELDSLLRPYVFPVQPIPARETMLYALLFAGLIATNLAAERFWCRYICPLGGLLGLAGKVSIFRRTVDETCIRCERCARECPTAAIDPQAGYASDPAECTLCMECFELCPSTSIHLRPAFKPAAWQKYDPGRRDALASSLVGIAALALLRAESHARRKPSFLLRPPGADEERILQRCVRCGACMAACPTGVLQPAIGEAGLEGAWTPVLVSRLGYCDYSCNACGEVCPVGAIPPLTLEEKRLQVIGKAYIDEDRCIAWADHGECIVCEEMCPIADKAIKLEERQATRVDGGTVNVKLPHVIREHCIGCGICEYQCPVNGDAAIRVYAANDIPGR